MKIGIISDTHDHAKNLLKAFSFLNQQKVDLIYHCGDWVSPFIFEFFFNVCRPNAPVKSVLGNNAGDVFMTLQRLGKNKFPLQLEPYTLKDQVDNKQIILYHGHDKNITEALTHSGLYDLVISGHTHQSLVEKLGNTLHINPGTTCGTNSSTIFTPTLAIYETDTNQAKIIKFLEK